MQDDALTNEEIKICRISPCLKWTDKTIVANKSPPGYSDRKIKTLVTDGAFGSVRDQGCRSRQAARIT